MNIFVLYSYYCGLRNRYTSIRTIVPAKLDLNKSGGCCSNSYRLHVLPVHRCKKPCLPVFALLSRFLSFLCLGPKKPVPVPACKKPCCCVNSEKNMNSIEFGFAVGIPCFQGPQVYINVINLLMSCFSCCLSGLSESREACDRHPAEDTRGVFGGIFSE